METKSTVYSLILLLCTLSFQASAQSESYKKNWKSLSKENAYNREPDWLKDAKFGIYLHWGVYSVPAYSYEWYSRHMFMESRKEYQYHKEHYGDPREFGYDKLVPLFRAEHFNAKEWVDLFQRAGAKFGEQRKTQAKLRENKTTEAVSLDDLFSKIGEGLKEINVLIKADVHGSSEAVKNSLEKIEVEDVRVKVVRSGVGAITESDIVLARASNAIIIGFNVRPNQAIKDYAEENGVEIRLYNIIYKAVEEIEAAMKGMLEPIYEEKIIGSAEVRQLFKFSKVGTIAGSYVTDGVIRNNSKARVIRDSVVIYDGDIGSVQREKDSVKEVKKGLECGITIENFNDIKVGDVIEAYEMVEIER